MMEREQQISRENYKQVKAEIIAGLTEAIYEKYKQVRLDHLYVLFNKVALKMRDNGLLPAELEQPIDAGDPYEGRTVTMRDILTYRASESVVDEAMAGTDKEWGDWSKEMASNDDAKNYLAEMAGKFEDELLGLVDKEEVLNG